MEPQKKYTYDYPMGTITVDNVVFTIRNGELYVLLIKRGEEPFKDCWALPGGYVEVDTGEDLVTAARRELAEETGVKKKDIYMFQIGAYGSADRDPRGYTCTVAYGALMSPMFAEFVEAGSDAVDAKWFLLKELPELAFDHPSIIQAALVKARAEVGSTNEAIISLCMPEFAQHEVRVAMETMMECDYNHKSFSVRFNKLVDDGTYVRIEATRSMPMGRPLILYQLGT